MMTITGKLRAYLTAHIHLSGKYALDTLTDDELAHVALMCGNCNVSFADWSKAIYGDDDSKPLASSNGYIDPNDLSEEDIVAINSKALVDLQNIR